MDCQRSSPSFSPAQATLTRPDRVRCKRIASSAFRSGLSPSIFATSSGMFNSTLLKPPASQSCKDILPLRTNLLAMRGLIRRQGETDVERQVESQPGVGITEIDLHDVGDAFQPVQHGVAVHVKHLRRFLWAAIRPKERLQLSLIHISEPT